MKNLRDAPWMYVGIAVFLFIIVVLASAGLTMYLMPSPPALLENSSIFTADYGRINYLPLVNRDTPTSAIAEDPYCLGVAPAP